MNAAKLPPGHLMAEVAPLLQELLGSVIKRGAVLVDEGERVPIGGLVGHELKNITW